MISTSPGSVINHPMVAVKLKMSREEKIKQYQERSKQKVELKKKTLSRASKTSNRLYSLTNFRNFSRRSIPNGFLHKSKAFEKFRITLADFFK